MPSHESLKFLPQPYPSVISVNVFIMFIHCYTGNLGTDVEEVDKTARKPNEKRKRKGKGQGVCNMHVL